MPQSKHKWHFPQKVTSFFQQLFQSHSCTTLKCQVNHYNSDTLQNITIDIINIYNTIKMLLGELHDKSQQENL